MPTWLTRIDRRVSPEPDGFPGNVPGTAVPGTPRASSRQLWLPRGCESSSHRLLKRVEPSSYRVHPPERCRPDVEIRTGQIARLNASLSRGGGYPKGFGQLAAPEREPVRPGLALGLLDRFGGSRGSTAVRQASASVKVIASGWRSLGVGSDRLDGVDSGCRSASVASASGRSRGRSFCAHQTTPFLPSSSRWPADHAVTKFLQSAPWLFNHGLVVSQPSRAAAWKTMQSGDLSRHANATPIDDASP